MCSEILWWRCHRRIIADVLVSLGARVIHIMDAKTAQTHRLRAPARLFRGMLSYLPEDQPPEERLRRRREIPRVSSRPSSRW
jgi:uncharacterized protein (DUF488 family)